MLSCVGVVERSEAIRCFLCSTSLDGDKCKSDQIANHNESSTGNCAYCQVSAFLCSYNAYRRMLWHIPVCGQYTIHHFEQLKTEAKVWTVETVIRSCAQKCGDIGTALLKTGYEWPTTIATIVHCCNDKDLCNTKIVDLKIK